MRSSFENRNMAKIIGFSLAYLTTAWSTSTTEESLFQFDYNLKDYRFIVAIGTDDMEDIFCLGSVVTQYSILTLASCFEEYNDELGPEFPDEYHESDEERRKLRAKRHRKFRAKRQRRKGEHGDDYDNYEGTFDDQTTDVEMSQDSEYADEQEAEPVPYSLFRIDTELQVFVRMSMDGTMLAPHSDYLPHAEDNVNLWRNNVAFLFTPTSMNFDTIRQIALSALEFGDYVKSLHEQMVNTMNCQVIGLIEYDDNGTYSPRDTGVELVARDVVVVYDKCNSTICIQDKDSCRNTGHHIHKDLINPLPYFIGGSPLVCHGKLLSVVNINSHCDDSRYSAEFAEPESVRNLLKHFNFLTEQKREAAKLPAPRPKIPRPRWLVKARGTTILSSKSSALILNLLGNLIVDSAY